MTTAETRSYRDRLIEDLMGHTTAAIQENRGGWATDRLNDIRESEWDMAEADEDFTPFILAHEMIRRGQVA
jgi:hypothetical protein